MKLGVLGHHPDLFPGFNSLMSANFCYGLSSAGHDVTLLLPETKTRSQFERLNKLRMNLSNLDRFGSESLDIQIIKESDKIERYDGIIWQSYHPEDEVFWPEIRKAARVVAKNFPRLFTGDLTLDSRAFLVRTDKFDVVGMSLRKDHEIAEYFFSQKFPERLARCIYQPRGFRADWLTSTGDYGDTPVFGIEKGVASTGEEYAYLKPVIKEIRRVYPGIEVIGARFDDPELTTRRVNKLPAREFYRQFISPLWAYLMINVENSKQSRNAVSVGGRRVFLGMYENQVIEAQLAGAAVIGHEDALPEEMVASEDNSLRFVNYGDSDRIVEFLHNVIKNRKQIEVIGREWAGRNHSILAMVKPFLDVL